jgi:protein-tyrosine phosphatase
MVCLGNICRSPLALAVVDHHARGRGVRERIDLDSCGTGGWHAGDGADPRTIEIAARHGLELRHTARQVRPMVDFERFTLLLAMDRKNRRDLLAMGAPAAKVRLMRSFDPAHAQAGEDAPDVPDPYYGGEDGFEHVYQMLDRSARGLLDRLDEFTVQPG